MKELRAIIRPGRLGRLRTALREIPQFPGMTVFQAEGVAAPASVSKRSVREELTDFSEKTMICILAPDDMIERIAETIVREGRTGQVGDGLIWVVPIEWTRRIRDSEQF